MFLENFSKFQQNIIMSAFAQAVREAAFTRSNKDVLVEGTVSATLSYVAQAFRSDNRPDPRLDIDGKICFILQDQLRGYRNQDGRRRKQKALPMMVLRKMLQISVTEREKAISWLLIGAIFFAMRSCEYLKTAAEETKRTKIVRIGNILFKKNNRVLPHSSTQLKSADLVRIRFEYQKNDHRDVLIHMFKSGDPELCPVVAWASVVKRVRIIPGSDDNSEVCLFSDTRQRTTLLKAEHVRTRLRAVVDIMGKEILGFNKEDIGLHSIRSGGAMAMFLSGTSVIVIQRVGRWSSEAFLEYIWEQVETFTLHVSKNMVEYEEFFNLDAENVSESTHVKLSNVETEDQIEDGQDSVPFCVRFNELALNGEE